ncbi:MAG: toll/interleukin-1 receptor domain-containing protein [Fulvivirga sp.]|uniref:toll/interleukin-1 receptor domain-containing protein n=1 Tax=Fulvivirga sp. TaxID=1931237 RepID=UPI0032ECB5A8
MAQLIEYFNNDFNDTSLDKTITVNYIIKHKLTGEEQNRKIEVRQRLYIGTNSSARFFTFYIPETQDIHFICDHLIDNLAELKKDADNIEFRGGFINDITLGEHESVYSNRIYFYCETALAANELDLLENKSRQNNLYLTIRSINYLNAKMQAEKPIAFISHDSADKAEIARPIAHGLNSRLCFVWYDEFTLKVGDNLRESIEKGIKETKKCILIITPNFLSNPGWTKKEFNSIFTKEVLFTEDIILPIWHNVTAKEVFEYSPDLANKFALQWPKKDSLGEAEYKKEIELIISKLHTSIKS